jgi:CheY-like chemotaxis protein
MVMRALKKADLAEFEFAEACDGVDAIEKLEGTSPDIVFLDWNMPRMCGLECAQKLRELGERHIPIVMVTTERTLDKFNEAMSLGAVDAFISKPFTPEDLHQKLAPLFEKSHDVEATGFFSRLASGGE